MAMSGGPARCTAVGHRRARLRARYGQALADEVAIPLVEAWSGLPAAAVAPSLGEKMDHGLLGTLWLRTAGRLTGHAVRSLPRPMRRLARRWRYRPGSTGC